MKKDMDASSCARCGHRCAEGTSTRICTHGVHIGAIGGAVQRADMTAHSLAFYLVGCQIAAACSRGLLVWTKMTLIKRAGWLNNEERGNGADGFYAIAS